MRRVKVSLLHYLRRGTLLLLCVLMCGDVFGQAGRSGRAVSPIFLLEKEGTVEWMPPAAAAWVPAKSNQVLRAGDRLATRALSRATIQWSDASLKRMDARSEILITAPPPGRAQPGWQLLAGRLFFWHRDKSFEGEFRTRTTTAAVRGTEFHVEVLEPDGTTILTLVDGVVLLQNDSGTVELHSGEQGRATPGVMPTRTAVATADILNVIQWCLYYPAVLHLDELALDAGTQQALSGSLAAYRGGDLLQALAKYPVGRQPASAMEQVYYAAVLLSVGRVDESQVLLDALAANPAQPQAALRLTGALKELVAAVKGQPWPRAAMPELATEWLAESYHRQSQADLEGALSAARAAVQAAPNFGFGWARVAELEFSFGRTGAALEALDKALDLSPRNAEALSLKGFLLGAQNRIRGAIQYFEQALEIDGALGNAWLGRGLCRIRSGDVEAGVHDLQTAVAVEPQRALLRSYLGKGYSTAGDRENAAKELSLAQRLDPRDPTAWLYSALLLQQNNRINEAVRDLEHSQELNDNRSLFRSRLLLDQDRSVRSANLANIYRDVGMTDWSVREAGRAVTADYANYSAHLFLANSYDELRDPNRINLRYETPAESEYLIANLLAPVGAGLLSQSVSQQEYSKLFERDRLGVSSTTEYWSRGAWREHGAQYGTFGNSSYLFDARYRTDPGQQPNGDFEERELQVHLKQQVTPRDSVYLRVIDYLAEGGDVFQHFDPDAAVQGYRTRERQDPIAHVGFHHEWSPGTRTLLLAGRLRDRFTVTNPAQPSLLVIKEDGVTPSFVQPVTVRLDYESELEGHTVEVQQIWQQPKWGTILGARYQLGDYSAEALQTDPQAGDNVGLFPTNGITAKTGVTPDFERVGAYAYQNWQVVDELQLIAGLSYDHIVFPRNHRAPPLSAGEESVDRLSPKAGVIWTPRQRSTMRFAYSQSVAGAGVDQSFQLEPTQVAGINQSFRSLIPESAVGALAGTRFEVFGLALEQSWTSGTFLGISGEVLNSKANRTIGVFDFTEANDFTVPGDTRERLDYQEHGLVAFLNQLLGRDWALGLRYRLVDADLKSDLAEIPDSVVVAAGTTFAPRQHLESMLHELEFQSVYQDPSGWFGQAQAVWTHQNSDGFQPVLPSEDFWQFNMYVGYRFARRRVEVRLGVLNLTDQDYRLNPLTLHDEKPRERTFVARLALSF